MWEVWTGGEPISCSSIACWPGDADSYELMASGCCLSPTARATLKGRVPITLSVGPSSCLSQQIRAIASIKDIREENGPGFQVFMSIELETGP